MIVPKVARALCVLAALSLVGCVVDATGEVDEQAPIGEAAWDLSLPDGDMPVAGDGQLDEVGLGDGAGQGDEETPVLLPASQVGEVAEPHPDPWMNEARPEAPGGSQD